MYYFKLCHHTPGYLRHITLHKPYYAIVVFGVLVTHTSALHNLHRLQCHLYGLYALAVYTSRKD